MCLSTRFVIENLTAIASSLFNTSKNGPDFEDLFGACALSSPVTFLTGAHVNISDLTRFVNKRFGYEINDSGPLFKLYCGLCISTVGRLANS